MMDEYFLSEINIYPIKSLGGISLQLAEVEERGLKHDRRLMLVDNSNRFVTQRSFPQMALIKVEIKKNLLVVMHKQNKLSPLTIQPFPFDEDKWRNVRIGDVKFKVIKPCSRCSITTVNQETGERGKEPLKALAKFRNSNGEVLFGQNMVCDKTGAVNIGDELYPAK
jgi:uncharacterized protein YcbX